MIATRERWLDGPLVEGIDVGGTETLVVVTDELARFQDEHVAPTDRTSLVGQIARHDIGAPEREGVGER